MGTRTRPYLALALMLAIPAKSSLATSAVEAARVYERAMESEAATDAGQSLPESPLAIAGPLAAGELELTIQLGAAEPEQRDARPVDLPFDVSLLGM
jgi:hypothetical protein